MTRPDVLQQVLLSEETRLRNLLRRQLAYANFRDEVSQRLIESTRQRLMKVQKERQLLDSSEQYGSCQECGLAIALERLLAMPGTSLCITCAQKHESFSHNAYREEPYLIDDGRCLK